LPLQLQQVKDQELTKITQETNDRYQQIEARIIQKKSELLKLLDQQSDDIQTDAENKIRKATQDIIVNQQSIGNKENEKVNFKQAITDQRLNTDNQIAIYDQTKDIDIQNKQNEINIWNQNQNPNYQQLQQELNRLDGEINQKNQLITQSNNQITSKDNQINQLRNDTSLQQIGTTLSYNEKSIYGKQNKGVVKEYKLSTHSSDAPLANIDYWGSTDAVSEGSAGYFDTNSRSLTTNTGQITYYGPSHYYGQAYFRAFAQRNDLASTKSSIATLQNEINQLTTQISDREREIRDLNRDKTHGRNQNNSLKTQNIANLNNDINALQIQKSTNRDRLDQAFNRFKLIKEGELNVLKNDISSLEANNNHLLDELNRYSQLQNLNTSKLIQEKDKIIEDADTDLQKNNQDRLVSLKKDQTSIEAGYKEKQKTGIKALEKEINQIETHTQIQLENYKKQIISKKENVAQDENFIKETLVDIENGNKIIDGCLATLEKSKTTFDEHHNNFIKIIELVKLLDGYRFEGFDEFIAKFTAFSKNYSNDEIINLLNDSKKSLKKSKDELTKCQQPGTQAAMIIPSTLFYHAPPQVVPTSTSQLHATLTTTATKTVSNTL
jgi:hypothetical protein